MSADPVPNSARGEAELVIAGQAHLLRPTFTALVAAEGELGSLFALVERASAGELRLEEMVALFWYCLVDRPTISREAVGQAVVAHGLAGVARPLGVLLRQILQGG